MDVLFKPARGGERAELAILIHYNRLVSGAYEVVEDASDVGFDLDAWNANTNNARVPVLAGVANVNVVAA